MLYPTYQYNLVSGQQIVCEVIEFPDDDTHEIICRNVLEIAEFMREDDAGSYEKYYAFKPWAHCQDGPTDIMIINSQHIISSSIPTSDLMSSYIDAREEGHRLSETRRIDHQHKQNMRLKEATDQLRKILDETKEQVEVETTKGNVISFPSFEDMDDDDTVH
jgi:hypothetical protein